MLRGLPAPRQDQPKRENFNNATLFLEHFCPGTSSDVWRSTYSQRSAAAHLTIHLQATRTLQAGIVRLNGGSKRPLECPSGASEIDNLPVLAHGLPNPNTQNPPFQNPSLWEDGALSDVFMQINRSGQGPMSKRHRFGIIGLEGSSPRMEPHSRQTG